MPSIDFEQADFYLLDVTDHKVKVIPSVDAYRIQGDLYLAITPLFEGLRLKYSLIGNKLSVTFADEVSEFDFLEELANEGQWFNDGSFTFIKASVLEKLFSTKIIINTNSLKMDFSGHTDNFPYKTIKNQQKQRKFNNYIVEQSETNKQTDSGAVITIKDQYRLATVPTGYASLEYRANDSKETYAAIIQTESDLAYHSASITLAHDGEETNSRVLLSRYPQFEGDKILGIWDQYSVGDLWLRKSSLTQGSSRGLGINFTANNKGNYNENMTTSFAKTARPGWDADIYHNGVFLETRVVPDDGLMEFNNLEVYYGANEFKIVLYGPYGEQETLLERVNVKSNALGQGDTSFGLSIKENDSSLLDVNFSEFDIDAIGASFNIGLFDNWQLGAAIDLNDIHNPNGSSESYRISNQFTLPGWFFQNNIAINQSSISQSSSLATSFLYNDNLTLKYNSQWQKDNSETKSNSSNISANYNIRLGATTNNMSYNYDDFGTSKNERLSYRFSYFNQYVNVSNSLTYSRRNDSEDRFFGGLNLTTRVNDALRAVVTIPYDINGEKTVNPEHISATFLYNYRKDTSNHSVSVSGRSFFEDNLWSVGYNLALNEATHQFTLRTQYDSTDNWSVNAGININFGYDYFNNEMVFSSNTLRGAGSFDVHTYLDRRLNGIPDILDYDLADVTFTGGKDWENVTTNQYGHARLFGAKNGVTALTANWDTGAETLNNDYLIYSHPGSLQRVNLPFYLTTEIELFVVLGNDSQTVILANVPLIASNISTGDKYVIETDYDGYASFVDLLPGKYHVYVDEKFLLEKGLQAEIGGFEFTSPLKGGFVVLPNIELSRSESSDIGANKLIKVSLDENNYAPLLETDNDKLVHLPPKGAMKAPYSTDKLHMAKFKKTKMQTTDKDHKELRNKIAAVAKKPKKSYLGLIQAKNKPMKSEFVIKNTPEPRTFTQPANSFNNSQVSNSEKTVKVGPIVSKLKLASLPLEVSSQLPVSQESNSESKDNTVDFNSGYVVQYAALKDLNTASQLAKQYIGIGEVLIARKEIKGQSMYCLISHVFNDKAAAIAYLKTTKKDGYVVEATKYIETI